MIFYMNFHIHPVSILAGDQPLSVMISRIPQIILNFIRKLSVLRLSCAGPV